MFKPSVFFYLLIHVDVATVVFFFIYFSKGITLPRRRESPSSGICASLTGWYIHLCAGIFAWYFQQG